MEIENSTKVCTDLIDTTSNATNRNLDESKLIINDATQTHHHIPYILNGELYEIQTQDGENVTVKCCHCPPDRVYRGSVRSTGNFHMHIKRRHPDLLGKLHEMKVSALLERRDRLLRNRKVIKKEIVHQESTQCRRSMGMGLMHTQKLKIKTAFHQRHQLQQKQQEQQQQQQLSTSRDSSQQQRHDWNVTPQFVVPPLTIEEVTQTNEPINYCTKDGMSCQLKIHEEGMYGNITDNMHSSQTMTLEEMSPTEVHEIGNINNMQHSSSSMNEQTPSYENISASATPCPSQVSAYSNNDLYVNNKTQCEKVIIIKPENVCTPEEAIDLSTQSSSFSSSGIGSAETVTFDTMSSASNTNANISATNMKWDELLLHVEASLRDIQREIRTRNQIETNRTLLDIAKFKYLNPGFNFRY